MFKKILIPNRGEIALRIMRTSMELGIEPIIAYSEADRKSLPVALASKAICIGDSLASSSYLNISSIISAATLLGVDAIHPGYGFLSENAQFAEIVEDYGIKFIGPGAKILKKLNNKANVRKLAQEAGVPVLPGTLKPLKDLEEATREAKNIRYPVMLKAARGGGGRGIKVVKNNDELKKIFPVAMSEAKANFDSDEIYLEKYLENPRHIEVQILKDKKGNLIDLGVRECSIQRRSQKIIEESPTVGLKEERINKIREDAKKFAEFVDYENAGTLEFLADSNENYYLMEVNARIQVEHPVTEETTGVDIVKEQILVAADESLSIKKSPEQTGWAIEFRINAEDYENDFKPTTGKIELLHLPGGRNVRVDTHLYVGYEIPSFYDSLLAKVIVKGSDRKEVLKIAKRALEETVIDGIIHNIPLHLKILKNKDFQAGKIHTKFLEEEILKK